MAHPMDEKPGEEAIQAAPPDRRPPGGVTLPEPPPPLHRSLFGALLPNRLAPLSGPLLGLAAVLALFLALFGARGELHRFLSPGNLQVLVHGHTPIAVAALGALLVIVSGGIDLSTGSVVALVTVGTMLTYNAVFGWTRSGWAA